MLASDEGRARFWAESAVEQDEHIHFLFPSGQSWRGEILAQQPPHIFRVVYLRGSIVTFSLETDLSYRNPALSSSRRAGSSDPARTLGASSPPIGGNRRPHGPPSCHKEEYVSPDRDRQRQIRRIGGERPIQHRYKNVHVTSPLLNSY